MENTEIIPNEIGLTMIREALGAILQPDSVAELRILGTSKGTISGYYSDHERLAVDAHKASESGKVKNVYFTLNPANRDLLARSNNRSQPYAKYTTGDSDILERIWLPIDFDPVRPSGISSTDDEHQAALERAIECRDWLSNRGWPEPILGDSGNGSHLLYRIQLPNDEASRNLVKNCIEAVAFQFSDELVDVDKTVYNAGRIWKVYGTISRKGDHLPERPHRRAKIIDSPDSIQVVEEGLLEKLASCLPQKPEPTGKRPSKSSSINLPDLIEENGLAVVKQKPWQDGTIRILETCPWNPEHTDQSAYIVQFGNGAKAAGCHHNGCSGKGLSDLKKVLNGAAESVIDVPVIESGSSLLKYPLTDLGNAERFVAYCGNEILYCPELGKWLKWDGKRWLTGGKGLVIPKAKETVRAFHTLVSGAFRDEVGEQLRKWAKGSESKARINNMIDLSQSDTDIQIAIDELDADPWKLNVVNGTIDLKTGELLPHCREDYMTKLIPIEYDPDATCPKFEKFLSEIMGGRGELVSYLKRIFGYCLTGDTSEQCMFILHGTGRNGKSTLIETIRSILGDYACQTDFTTLLDVKYDTIRNDLARLPGARFVSAVEADSNRSLSEVMIKQLTGGDRITARFLHNEFFEFTPDFKILLATNHKPHVREINIAIWRRLKLIPFDVTIAEQDQDKHLVDKLKSELQGVLTWAVQGCLEWQKYGLGDPDRVVEATRAYKEEMDQVASFLAARCEFDEAEAVTTKELYAAYEEWCSDTGETIESQTQFGKRLNERGIGSDRKGPKGATRRLGLKLV